MERLVQRSESQAPQESPEEGARREMLAAAERTLSSGEYDLLERVIGATTTEEMQEDIETFNALKAGVPDTEESLAERESTVSFSVRSGNTLRIARSTRGVFQLSIAGAN